MSGYNPKIVTACFVNEGIPAPFYEFKFHAERKWRFDLAWVLRPKYLLAIEVQGGIWSKGRHTQGAAMLREWEKLNAAAVLGWRILYCQPDDLCRSAMVLTIKRAMNLI